MSSAVARAAAVAVALALAGCPLRARSPLPPTREGEWAAARDASTRRAILYDGLRHRATATATHLTLAAREARARRLAEWLGWTPKELEDRLAQERADAALGEEVLVSFFSADPRWNDLDAPRSVWRIALKLEDTDLLAKRATGLEPNATVGGLFPYVGPFDVVYRVTFPRAPGGALDGKPFMLEIASALGKLTMDFGTEPEAPTVEPWQPVPAP